MKIARFRQAGMSALAVLLISGAGIAFAGTAPTGAVAPVTAPATTAEPAEPAEPAGVDTDTLEQGDQTTPDVAPAAAKVAPAAVQAVAPTVTNPATEPAGEATGTETEKAGVEEPGDANLPGGGHADDPNDPNADHQFEGVE
jgi:hypothetical protein